MRMRVRVRVRCSRAPPTTTTTTLRAKHRSPPRLQLFPLMVLTLIGVEVPPAPSPLAARPVLLGLVELLLGMSMVVLEGAAPGTSSARVATPTSSSSSPSGRRHARSCRCCCCCCCCRRMGGD